MDHRSQYKLVITIALAQECPDISEYPCIDKASLKALLAGDYRTFTDEASVLLIITGVGKENSISVAQWINHHLKPMTVINMGSAGAINKEIELNSLVTAQYLCEDNSEDKLPVWDKFPFFTDLNYAQRALCRSLSSPNASFSEKADVIDMEAYFQASELAKASIPFVTLKYITDYNNTNKMNDFQTNLKALKPCFQKIFDKCFAPIDIDGVSVIIPTFNRSIFIEKSVQSVLNQTISSFPFECIVVDDGSTDNTLEILEKFKKDIKIVESNENKGVSAARNLGVAKSRYNWVCFLDSDDEWKLEKLAKQVAYLKQHPYLSILQSDEKWVKNTKEVHKKAHWRKKEGFIWPESLLRCTISPSTVMINKDLFNEHHGFDESFAACEDYDLWLKLTRSLLIGLVDDELSIKYAGHDDQLSVCVPALDRFRVRTLASVISNEKHDYFLSELQTVLAKKQSILEKGRLKRL